MEGTNLRRSDDLLRRTTVARRVPLQGDQPPLRRITVAE